MRFGLAIHLPHRIRPSQERQIRAFRVFLVRAGYGANMPKQPRSRWAIPLVVLTALWGLVLIVMTAFLIAMSLNGQPFSPSALIAGAAVAFGAFITLAPVLSWLRNLGNQRLGATIAPGMATMVAVGAWLLYLLRQPPIGS